MRYFIIFILCFVLVGFISTGESGEKTEARYNEPGYAYDSGSFNLTDAEFTKISVTASVQNGENKIEYEIMYADAYIELDCCSIRASASAKTNDSDFDDENIDGYHISCPEWYWVIQASGNPGTGTAICHWEWYDF